MVDDMVVEKNITFQSHCEQTWLQFRSSSYCLFTKRQSCWFIISWLEQ